jgi:methionyl-tRNA formyltransferase
MIKVAFVIYRQWGYDIFKNIYEYQKLRQDLLVDTLLYPKAREFILDAEIKKNIHTAVVEPNDINTIYKLLKERDINIVFLYSWSWLVKKPLLDSFICICLHPSPLPKYRGGTPIQNQIINGEMDSAVTLFKMNEGIDAGDIYQQTAISLLGNINNIFDRMTDVGTIMTKNLINDALNRDLKFEPQNDLDKYPPLKRRKPEQSEITLMELKTKKFAELNNFVRGLLAPYPNAFIRFDTQVLKIQEVLHHKELPQNAIFIKDNINILQRGSSCYIEIEDGYAEIVKYSIDR